MKYLLLILIALVLWWVWKKRIETGPEETQLPEPKKPETMVTCAHCGVHHPLSESVSDGADHYCSTAHRLAAKASDKS